jgi:hypothetical protein
MNMLDRIARQASNTWENCQLLPSSHFLNLFTRSPGAVRAHR